MDDVLKNNILFNLHFVPGFKRSEFVINHLELQNITSEKHPELLESIMSEFKSSIGILNSKQFENLTQLSSKEFNASTIRRKLDIYNVKAECYESILKFFKEFNLNYEQIIGNYNNLLKVEITPQNVKTIIKQGWIGDLETNPEDGKLNIVKIPAFVTSGMKKRFFLAKIFKTIPVKYKDKIRYRVYFLNPRIVIS